MPYAYSRLRIRTVAFSLEVLKSAYPLTYEIVGYSSHPLRCHHNPDDNKVTAGGHYNHAAEENAPKHLTPPRKHECKRAGRLHGPRRIFIRHVGQLCGKAVGQGLHGKQRGISDIEIKCVLCFTAPRHSTAPPKRVPSG